MHALAAIGLLCACLSQQAPQLEFSTLSGQVLGPKQLHNTVRLVHFWATSCSTCIQEMPQLIATQQKYGNQGFRTLAVAMQYDNPNHVRNFVQTRQLPFDVVLDSTGRIAQAFGSVQITPTTYLINRKGQIIKTYVGEPDFPTLHRLIEQALAD